MLADRLMLGTALLVLAHCIACGVESQDTGSDRAMQTKAAEAEQEPDVATSEMPTDGQGGATQAIDTMQGSGGAIAIGGGPNPSPGDDLTCDDSATSKSFDAGAPSAVCAEDDDCSFFCPDEPPGDGTTCSSRYEDGAPYTGTGPACDYVSFTCYCVCDLCEDHDESEWRCTRPTVECGPDAGR